MSEKRCIDCERTLDVQMFHKDARRKDGLCLYCKDCKREKGAAYYEARHGSTHPLKKGRGLPPERRFWQSHRADPGGCWIWLGSPQGSNGYGRIKVDGKYVPAHRFSWAIHFGPVPDGMHVCHTCDTPLCVYPGHLFLGTNQDNVNDKVSKRRQASGETLSQAQRAGWASRDPIKEAARRHKISNHWRSKRELREA